MFRETSHGLPPTCGCLLSRCKAASLLPWRERPACDSQQASNCGLGAPPSSSPSGHLPPHTQAAPFRPIRPRSSTAEAQSEERISTTEHTEGTEITEKIARQP
jgi:hypothetical protein